jgi:hypothetical protein
MRKEDNEADGDLPEFDVKKGPGRQLTKEEKTDIQINVAPNITHRAHLRRDDFDKHGYTDRCPICSALLRGLHAQPHTAECRARLENALGNDVRIKNAKIKMQERNKKIKQDGAVGENMSKKRKLDDIERHQ